VAVSLQSGKPRSETEISKPNILQYVYLRLNSQKSKIY
jgi:hypothetical protein